MSECRMYLRRPWWNLWASFTAPSTASAPELQK